MRQQVCVVPAGQGKSRIEAALALYLLMSTKVNVYMVYPNDGLLKRDKREYETLLAFVDAYDRKAL